MNPFHRCQANLRNFEGIDQEVRLSTGFEKLCSQVGQKGSRCEAREKSTRGGVLRRYIGATPIGAKMISAPLERTYPKRLPRIGWWQMGLFQRPVQFLTTFDLRCYPSVNTTAL